MLKVLEEFKDVILTELPKKLPHRRDVYHKIELQLGAKMLTISSYRMAPLELEELERQLKELFEAKYIQPSKTLKKLLCSFKRRRMILYGYALTIELLKR